MSNKKKIWILFGVLLALFVLFDFSYLWEHTRYFFSSRKVTYRNFTASNSQSAAKIEPNVLVIESLNIAAPVVYATTSSEQAFQSALQSGVVHYPGTAYPGDLGNCYIFGHSSDFIWNHGKYKSVFAMLPQIAVGAEIQLSDVEGNLFTYVVKESRKVAADDVTVLSQQDYKKRLLSLQTSYPIGTALARWVVVAELKE